MSNLCLRYFNNKFKIYPEYVEVMSKYCLVLVVCKYGSFVSLLYRDYRVSLRGAGGRTGS